MLDPVLSLPPQGDPLPVPRFPCVLSPRSDPPTLLLGVGSCPRLVCGAAFALRGAWLASSGGAGCI